MRTLKNFLMLGLLPILALAFVGCEKGPNETPNGPTPEKDSVIKLKQETVSTTYGGGTVMVSYTIENPHAGEKISVKAEDSWVGGFDTSFTGAFKMVVEPNDSGAARQTLVTVSYRYAEDVSFVLKQDTKLNAGFVIENVSAVDEYFSYTVNVMPTNKTAPFIMMSSDVFYIHEFPNGGTDEELYSDDMAYFGYLGGFYNMSAVEVLQTRVKLGDQMNITLSGAIPGQRYVFYAYYVDVETGARLSDIERLEFAVMHPELGDVDFTFEATVDGPSADTSAVPATTVENYYFDVISEAELNWAAEVGFSKEEYIKVWWATTVVNRMSDTSIEQIIADSTCVGDNPDGSPRSEYFYELAAGTNYYLFAFEIDSTNALCVSTPKYEAFLTGYPEPSDNVISIKVEEVSAYTADIAFTTTNLDHYVAGWETAENWVSYGANDAERMEFMISKIAFEYLHGNQSTKAKGLTPETEYVVYAFGMRGGVATTGLTTERFTTSDPNAGKVSITMNENLTYYRADEIADIDSTKWGFMAGSDYQEFAIVAMEWQFSSPYYRTFAFDCYNWEGRTDEYTDQQYIDHLIFMIEQGQDTGATFTYYMIPWENRCVFHAICVDEDGNYSKLYKREMRPLQSQAGDAQEFVDWWVRCEEDQNSGGLQSLVIEKSSIDTPLFRTKTQRFRASQYELTENPVPAVDEMVAYR